MEIVVPIVLAAVVFALTVVLLVARSVLPSDGGGHVDGEVLSGGGLAVQPPYPGATELRAGMVVLAIDGQAVDDLLRGRLRDRNVATGDVVRYTVSDRGVIRDLNVTLIQARIGQSIGRRVAIPAFVTAMMLLLGLYVLRRRPREPAAVAFATFCVAVFCVILQSVIACEPADLAFRPWLWWLAIETIGLSFSVYLGALSHFLLVFPRRPAVLERRPALVTTAYLSVFLWALGIQVWMFATGDVSYRRLTQLNSLAPLPILLFFGGGLVNVFVNLLRVRRDADARREFRIVGVGAAVSTLSLVILNAVEATVAPVPEVLYLVTLPAFPLSIAYALLRRGLFDVRAVVNRTIVYALVTLTLVGAYSVALEAIVNGLSFSDRSATLLLTALAAVVFAPARLRAQRIVDRAMYGRRDDPYLVLAEIGRSIQASAGPIDALQQLVDALRATLRLPYAAITLGTDTRLAPIVESGAALPDTTEFPLTHAGIPVGALFVAPRSPGEQFAASDMALMNDAATQAAVAANAVRLSNALARSRQRALSASEDERQRIRRDLHDGLGPTLAALSLQTRAALDRLQSNHPAAESVVQAEAAATLAKSEVRRIIDGMAPVQLEHFGLMAAIRALGDQFNAAATSGTRGHPRTIISGPAGVESIDPVVEVGAYRIVSEAMLNAVRHSQGSRCDVVVEPEIDRIVITVDDDGVGPGDRGDVEATPSSAVATASNLVSRLGIASMRSRAEHAGRVR